ncbi:MAG: MiaB/RimO family radical SAM methylthiotransferase, partial [bacterium]
HKALSELGRAASFKRHNPHALVGVCGCVAQQDGAGLLDRYPGVDFVFGPDQIWRLPELIENAQAGCRGAALELIDDLKAYRFLDHTPRVSGDHLINPLPFATEAGDPLKVGGRGSTRRREPEGERGGTGWGRSASPDPSLQRRGAHAVTSFVTITKGCNCACSYCIVPSVRGREISRPADDIVLEVTRLADSGAKEVTLLGQNVSAYGGEGGLAALIGRIALETKILRIRFTSPHPRWIGEELLREYAQNEKLCPHLHLPVQAGSNAVLKRMRRGYTRERYAGIARALRAAREGMSITTDLIVGFPGETRQDFEDTLALMREVGFDQAFAFKYSPRPGTEAAHEMDDDVPQAEKEERLSILLDLQRQMSRRSNEALVGKKDAALATTMDRMHKVLVTGRLPDNRIVHFAGHPGLIGDIVPVTITAAHDNSLSCVILSVAKDPLKSEGVHR